MNNQNVTDKKNNEPLPWHLQGNWAPVKKELTESNLTIKGEIPKGLNGLYVRNGANPRSGWSDHWFFGNGMLHGIKFEEGKVTYKNRYVKTPYYEKDLDVISSFGDLKASSANTHIIKHAGKLLALEEAHLPWEVNEELETLGVFNFSGKLNGAMTAHPRICPETGELLFFAYSLMTEPYLTYYRVSSEGELIQTEPIEIPRPVMMHDWNITRNHVIFMDLPIVSDMDLAITTGSPFGFKPEYGARLGVMPRKGTGIDIRWFEIDPCYVFHTFNAHEQENKVILHVSRQKEAMVGGLKDIYGGDSTVARPWRWIIDLDNGTVQEEQLDDAPSDFPRIDDRKIGLKAEHGYCVQFDTSTDSLTIGKHLYKYNLTTGSKQSHDLGNNVAGGEPVFVPQEPNSSEDKGWVMSLVHEREERKSKLVIIDSQNFESTPVAEIYLPQRVPYGAHGSWIPAN